MTAARRAGSILLYVLAALALVLPVGLGLARTVTTAALDRSLREDEELAQSLLREAEVPIQEWLAAEADAVVLRPDWPYPAVLVLEEEVQLGEKSCALRIVAWDQCGLVQLPVAAGANPLRLELPREVVDRVDAVKRTGRLPGLDWFAREDDVEGPFPPTPNVEHLDGGTTLRWPRSTGRCVGALLATHSTSRINVSTAPRPIVEAALRELGRGGVDRIMNARHKGELAPIPPAGTDAPERESRLIELVSTSDCWGFRVDAAAGKVRRSAWLIFRPDEARWRRVQRLLITTG